MLQEQLPRYAQTRKYLYKRARQVILQSMRISPISSTHQHNCLPRVASLYFKDSSGAQHMVAAHGGWS